MATGGRLAAVVTAGLLLAGAAGCSGSDGGVIDPGEASEAASTGSTAPAIVETTTTSTTRPTSTTLSDEAVAEAEVREVVEAWFFHPQDTSKGDEGIGAQYLTGLMLQRGREIAERRTAAGEVELSGGEQRLRLFAIDVDLPAGFAEAAACFVPGFIVQDATTGEVLSRDDPNLTVSSTFQATLTDEGWKISDFLIDQDADGDYVPCEIDP